MALDQREDAMDLVFALVGERPAAVFWACAAGETVLHRHLRTLNIARIPSWAAVGESEPSTDGSRQTFETVMFRHWDPRVLASLLPELEAGQFSRIVGPAEAIALWAEDEVKLRRVVADAAWPRAPAGMLTIRSGQIEALNKRRMTASRDRIGSYLRAVAPEETAGAPDHLVRAHVEFSEQTGRALGIATEAGHARWAFVMCKTNGRILQLPDALAFVRRGGSSPDEQVRALMDEVIAELRRRSARASR